MAEQKVLERMAQIAAKEVCDREQDARLETLRKAARRRLGLGLINQQQTAFLPTLASTKKIREKVENLDQFEDCNTFDEDDALAKYRQGRPGMFKLYTFTEDEILADPRLVVENILRERGLLAGSTYAVNQIMKELKPPGKHRPDLVSHLKSL
jgi:hypothetical protein